MNRGNSHSRLEVEKVTLGDLWRTVSFLSGQNCIRGALSYSVVSLLAPNWEKLEEQVSPILFSINIAKGIVDPGVDCFDQLFWLSRFGSVCLIG